LVSECLRGNLMSRSSMSSAELSISGPQSLWGRRLQGAAFALLVAVAAARPFLGEMPHRAATMRLSAVAEGDSSRQADLHGVDRGELSRVSFAVLLLVAGAIWAAGLALCGAPVVRHGWLGALILVFAAVGLVCALHATDRRTALDVWIEQVSILSAAFLFAQLCTDRRRFALLVVVLAAVGGTLAFKGLWQYFVEVPQRIQEFGAQRDKQLQVSGWTPGTPGAALFEARVRDPSVTGFFGLGNPLGSLLNVLLGAGAGLAADKLLAAVRDLRSARTRLRRGEVHLPMLAGVVWALVAVLVAAVLVMTRSRGGMVSAVLAAAASLAILRHRRRLARHWRKAILTVAGAFLVGAGAVAAYGLAKDSLPTTTMTFRWHYWSASAQIIRDHPFLGVGPGNFPAAYLQYRRPQAEEEVKTPHNVLLHAAVQFGLPGGALYVGIVAYVLVGISRPGGGGRLKAPSGPRVPGGSPARKPGGGAREWVVCAVVVLGVLETRVIFSDATADVYVLVFDSILPAIVLALCLVAAGWGGKGWFSGLESVGPVTRTVLACGAGGFVLHSMIEFGPWMPAPALAFWSAAGALLGQAGQDRPRRLPGSGWAFAAGAAAAAVAAGVVLWWPVYLKTARTADAAVQVAAGDAAAAVLSAEQAAEADRLDALAAADAARMHLAACPRGKDVGLYPAVVAQRLRRAEWWAKEALRRDPSVSVLYQLAAGIAWMQAEPGELRHSWSAPAGKLDEIAGKLHAELRQDPENEVLMSRLAKVLARQGRCAEAVAMCETAVNRDPTSAVLWAQLGEAAWRGGRHDKARAAWLRADGLEPRGPSLQAAFLYMDRAVELNPQDMRLRVAYAEMLCSAGRYHQCLGHLEAARNIDRLLLPQSVERLTPAEAEAVTMLNARAEALVSREIPATGSRPGG